MNANVLGKLMYMLPFFSSATVLNMNKIHKLLMFAARTVIGNYCFKKSTSYILGKCNWVTAEQLIRMSGLKLIHSILSTRQPKAICNMLKINKWSTANIALKRVPICKIGREFYINMEIKNYNRLPSDIKSSNKKQFKSKVRKFLKSEYSVP